MEVEKRNSPALTMLRRTVQGIVSKECPTSACEGDFAYLPASGETQSFTSWTPTEAPASA